MVVDPYPQQAAQISTKPLACPPQHEMYIYVNAIILKNHFQVRGTTVFTDLSEFPYALGLISYTEAWLQKQRSPGNWDSLYVAVCLS